MNKRERRWFDEQLEVVLETLPPHLLQMLEDVPLIVEDHPSEEVMAEMDVEYLDELCGLYDGVPLTAGSERETRATPDCILIYRQGILSEAADDDGQVSEDELRRQIRITVLHEIGHHHGLGEEDLRELGYG